MIEIGKLDTVNVGTCKVEITKHDGETFITPEFVGSASQSYSRCGWFRGKRIVYQSPRIETAEMWAQHYISNVVRIKHAIIDNQLIKYEDIRVMRVVDSQTRNERPAYFDSDDGWIF